VIRLAPIVTLSRHLPSYAARAIRRSAVCPERGVVAM
jgi:hypothetical protein